MDREKQIEEMAEDMYNALPDYEHNHRDCEHAAEKMYADGYRKQSEGEWKKVYQNDKATVYECSNCHHLTFGISDYCICGAKMKGGEG